MDATNPTPPPQPSGPLSAPPQNKISPMAKFVAEGMINNYRLTPATLYSRIDPTWIAKPFLLQASLKIAQTIAKPDGRLIISWPPRHGKSRLATIATPIWILENFPHLNIILATYGADLSTDFGREVRDIMEQNAPLLNERIRKDVKSVGRFMTTKGGGMLSVGLGGAIIGKGADTLLIDDYIKTMKEAQSPAKHAADWEWFRGTAYHRLEPGGSIIIIATRWHKNDLIGRILREFPGEFEHIIFQAEAGPNDPLGREVGGALFPERYDEKALANRRKVLGSYYYNAIYQQNPEDDESKLTDREWIEIVDEIPLGTNLVYARIWDFGGGKRKKADPSVGTLIGVDPKTNFCYVLNIWRKRATPKTIEEKVRSLAESDGTGTMICLEQEPGASGVALVAHYTDTILPDYNVEAFPATTSKVVRAQPMLAAAEQGKVKLLKGKWNETFLDEFDMFPNEESHDDQVDTLAIGYNRLATVKKKSPVWGQSLREMVARATEGEDADSEGNRIIKPVSNKVITPQEAQGLIRGATWGRRR